MKISDAAIDAAIAATNETKDWTWAILGTRAIEVERCTIMRGTPGTDSWQVEREVWVIHLYAHEHDGVFTIRCLEERQCEDFEDNFTLIERVAFTTRREALLYWNEAVRHYSPVFKEAA